MKSRKVHISMDLRTDIPMKWLKEKRRWQSLMDLCYHLTGNPIPIDYLVERVHVIKLEG